jgi:hypothetical protein
MIAPHRRPERSERPLDKDPAFALAYAGLADTYQVAGLQGGSDGAARARQAAEQALALDDTLGEAHASLAATLHRQLLSGGSPRV